MEEVPTARVRHDYYVFQVSLTQQDVQIHNVIVDVFVIVETIFAQDMVKEGLILLKLIDDLFGITVNIGAEKDQFKVLLQFKEHFFIVRTVI